MSVNLLIIFIHVMQKYVSFGLDLKPVPGDMYDGGATWRI